MEITAFWMNLRIECDWHPSIYGQPSCCSANYRCTDDRYERRVSATQADLPSGAYPRGQALGERVMLYERTRDHTGG